MIKKYKVNLKIGFNCCELNIADIYIFMMVFIFEKTGYINFPHKTCPQLFPENVINIPKFYAIISWKIAKIPILSTINTWKSAKIPKLSTINAWKCAKNNKTVCD